MKRFWIETYGCQMNSAESNAIVNDLKSRGWIEADSDENADFVLLNTCSVRQTAENRIWGRIGYFKHLKEKSDLTLAITGCMAERLKNELKNKAGSVDMIIGNYEKEKIGEYLDTHKKWNSDLYSESEYSFRNLHHSGNSFKAMVPIMHGCNNFCSYCIVPYVRGREVSRTPETIIEELKILEESGVKEVTLLGQNVNSYNYRETSRDLDFPGLLNMILEKTDKIKWIRFMSSHPKDVSDSLISMIGESDRICSHIHLAVQHGSDKILERMNRKYTKSDFLQLVDKIKTKVPDVSLTTDLLIGFPGETLEDLEETKLLMKEVRFDDAFTYYYNPREGTKAFDYNDSLDSKEKLRRLNEIILLQRSIIHDIKESRLGKTVKVLVEDVSRKNSNELLARNEKNEMIVFPGEGSLKGEFRDVRLESLRGNTYRGILLNE